MLDRDWAKNPIPYHHKVKQRPEIRGLITSKDGLTKAVEEALEVYRTDDILTALRRIGLGICPKSFPIDAQSFYFLDLYNKTHGGETGNQLINLPNSGGVLDQPNIFFSASEIIGIQRSKFLQRKLDEANAGKDKVHQRADNGESGSGRERTDRRRPRGIQAESYPTGKDR